MDVRFSTERLKKACESKPERVRRYGVPAAQKLVTRLAGGLRLIVAPTKQPPPAKADGGLDWQAVDDITVIEVVDYHD